MLNYVCLGHPVNLHIFQGFACHSVIEKRSEKGDKAS